MVSQTLETHEKSSRSQSIAELRHAVGRQRLRTVSVSVLSLAVFFAVWQEAPSLGLVNAEWSSRPSTITHTLGILLANGTIARNLGVSGEEFLYGYAMAAIVGVLVGFSMGLTWWTKAILNPLVAFFKAMPRVALIPIFVIWLGIGVWSKVAIIFLTSVFPIILNSNTGFTTVDPSLLRVADAFNSSKLKRFTTVTLPSAVPFVISGLRLAVGQAIIAVVYAEFYAAAAGIGYFIGLAGQEFRVDEVFAGIITVSFIGLLFDYILLWVESKFSKWRPEH